MSFRRLRGFSRIRLAFVAALISIGLLSSLHPAAADGAYWDKLERDVVAEKLRETTVDVAAIIVQHPDIPLVDASEVLDSALHKALRAFVAAGAVDSYRIGLVLDEKTRAVTARVVFRLRDGGPQDQTILRLNCQAASAARGLPI